MAEETGCINTYENEPRQEPYVSTPPKRVTAEQERTPNEDQVRNRLAKADQYKPALLSEAHLETGSQTNDKQSSCALADFGGLSGESLRSVQASKRGAKGEAVKCLKSLEDAVSAWPHISVHPHRFGGREFIFGSAEVGHVHTGGLVDIPFPRPVHDALLSEGLAEEHRWVPNSGWITFRIRSEPDINHALWLMRLSYLRYALKGAADPRTMFEQESEELRLSPRFKSLLEPFVPKKVKQVSAELLPV